MSLMADSSTLPNELKLSPDFLRQQVQKDLVADILESISALPTSGISFDKFNLAQTANLYSVSVEEVERIAKQISEIFCGQDLDEKDYRQTLQRMERIEQIKDPGYREWKLQGLAREVKRTPRQLREIYNKSLVQHLMNKPLTIEEFYATAQQQTEWLIQGWIPRASTVLLHGDGGSGKTLFSYQLLEAILHATPWQGYQVHAGPVLLLQSDEPPVVTTERLLVRGITKDDAIHIIPGWQSDQIERLETYIQELLPSFVLVDSNTAINRNSFFNENDTEYARPILQFADLASRYNCTFLIIHHSNAAGESRGTRAIYNSVSEVWGLSVATENSTDRLLRVQKTRLGRPPGKYRFRFSEDDFSFEYLGEEKGDGEVEDNRSAENRVLRWLMDDEFIGTRFAAIELAEKLSINSNTVRRCLQELWAKGLVKRGRSEGARHYVYYVERIIPTDQLINSENDRSLELITLQPSQGEDYNPSDQLISQKREKFTNENCIFERSVDHLERSGDGTETSQESQPSNQLINQLINPLERPDQFAISPEIVTITQQFRIGDRVIANGSATWLKRGSDKLPYRELRPSQKEQDEILIADLPDHLFHQLQTPSKVLEIKRDRVKIRSQENGRTSVFRAADLRLLERRGQE